MFDVLMQDVSYAARILRRTTRFSVPATLTLALGIGVNTGLFSILYGVLLRPLPYDSAARLALIEAERDYEGTGRPVRAYFPLAELDTWTQRPSFESVAFYSTDVGALSSGSRTEAVDFVTVSGSFFATLAGPFRLGRPLAPADDLTPSVVISERLWRRLFGGSADIIGQRVLLSSQRGDGGQRVMWRRTPFTLIGAADSALHFPSPQIDVWTPAGFVRTVVPRCCSFSPVARLRSGVALDEANADTRLVAAALTATNAREYSGLRMRVAGLHQELVREGRPSLWVLFAAGGLVLLVSFRNVP